MSDTPATERRELSIVNTAVQITSAGVLTTIYGNSTSIQLSGSGNVTTAYGSYIYTSRTSTDKSPISTDCIYKPSVRASTLNYAIYTNLGTRIDLVTKLKLSEQLTETNSKLLALRLKLCPSGTSLTTPPQPTLSATSCNSKRKAQARRQTG